MNAASDMRLRQAIPLSDAFLSVFDLIVATDYGDLAKVMNGDCDPGDYDPEAIRCDLANAIENTRTALNLTLADDAETSGLLSDLVTERWPDLGTFLTDTTDQGEPDDGSRCSNPGGHEWNRSAGEADEAFLAREDDAGIRCVHCGADGDA